jgi:hypothetical protein
MPKKSTARTSAQRNKSKSQKGFELVLPTSTEVTASSEEMVPAEATSTSTLSATAESTPKTVPPKATLEKPKTSEESKTAREAKASLAAAPVMEGDSSALAELPKSSAAARLAARRQVGQKAQQRPASSLITPEHYAYVRRDLLFIAVLAIIMFSVIIILHFVPGIGS